MSKTNIKYPRCHSNKLYKFGLDKQANQKYQCKKCNHIIVKPHSINIDNSSSEVITGFLSMKGMRFPLHVILTALTLYFLNNSSTRAISQFLMINSGIKVSHVTIASWTNKFTSFFKQKADKFKSDLDLQSDDWHADETVIFINS